MITLQAHEYQPINTLTKQELQDGVLYISHQLARVRGNSLRARLHDKRDGMVTRLGQINE